MPNSESVDVIVIGGGPGGYTAAERVAQLEGRVILVEKNSLGGNCLNRGCIPAVALLRSAQILSYVKMAKPFGVNVSEVFVDYDALMKRKNDLVESLVAGTERRLASTGVTIVKGNAIVTGPKTVKIQKSSSESETMVAKNIIVATGSKPLESNIQFQGRKKPVMAEEAFGLRRLPRSMAVVGCDYIGVQLASIFNRLGTDVTIVESGPRLLPGEDEEMSALLQEILAAYGVKIIFEAQAAKITSRTVEGETLTLAMKDGTKNIEVEEVIASKGRRPNTQGLGLQEIGVMMNDKGGIVVDEHMRTKVQNVYAIGDAVGEFMLAQVAMAEGSIAAENAMGQDSKVDYKALPRCIFTLPEMASVGLTEKQATELGYKVRVSRVPLELNGFAHLMMETEGMIKIVSDANFGEVLGMQIIGPQAVDLIHEAALGMRLEATVEDMSKTIRVHPSLAESVRDAALRLYRPPL